MSDLIVMKCKRCGEIVPFVIGGPAVPHMLHKHNWMFGDNGQNTLRFADHFDLIYEDGNPVRFDDGGFVIPREEVAP